MARFDHNKRIEADAAFLKGDFEAAFWGYFEGAVDFGDARSAFNLAFMYHQGYHTPRNYVWARKYYHLASYYYGGEAKFNLALMHMRGQGGDTDHRTAFDLMKASAAEGCVHAQMYLGVAYTLGCIFDPVETECISLIPFPRIIKRDTNVLLLTGNNQDPALEDQRFEIIEADGNDAVEMFRLAAEQKDDTYIEEEVGQAKFEVGRAIAEGLGSEYDPQKGFKLMETAALTYDCKDALRYLHKNAPAAQVYGINTRRIALLLGEAEV